MERQGWVIMPVRTQSGAACAGGAETTFSCEAVQKQNEMGYVCMGSYDCACT